MSLKTVSLLRLLQALKQMMLQLDHERNLKLDAFERVEDLQRQVTLYINTQTLFYFLKLVLSSTFRTSLVD